MTTFADVRSFFTDMRSFRGVAKQNQVDVYFLNPANKLIQLHGRYDNDLDSVEVLTAGKNIYLNGKGMYSDKKGRNCIVAAYNRAVALRPDQDKQDYLTGEQVETLLKAGLLNQVLKPNLTLGIVGFILGVAFASFLITVVFGVSFL